MEEDQQAEVLAKKIKAGDRAALGEFIALRTPQLLAFIHKRMNEGLKKKVEAEDILQELTLSCLNSLDAVDLGDRDPFSWLCQQAERRIIDAHRHHFGAQKRAAGKEVGLQSPAGIEGGGGLGEMIAASMTSPSKAFARNQKEFHLLEALRELPEDAREALQLRYLEGLSSKEIAERMQKTDGATRVLLSRALTKLQAVLAGNTEFQTLLAQAKRN